MRARALPLNRTSGRSISKRRNASSDSDSPSSSRTAGMGSGIELLVADAMGCIGVVALAPTEVFHVLGVIALEPHDFAVALEREDVGRDPVEEPAIVGDHDSAAREGEQRFLERTQRL